MIADGWGIERIGVRGRTGLLSDVGRVEGALEIVWGMVATRASGGGGGGCGGGAGEGRAAGELGRGGLVRGCGDGDLVVVIQELGQTRLSGDGVRGDGRETMRGSEGGRGRGLLGRRIVVIGGRVLGLPAGKVKVVVGSRHL